MTTQRRIYLIGQAVKIVTTVRCAADAAIRSRRFELGIVVLVTRVDETWKYRIAVWRHGLTYVEHYQDELAPLSITALCIRRGGELECTPSPIDGSCYWCSNDLPNTPHCDCEASDG